MIYFLSKSLFEHTYWNLRIIIFIDLCSPVLPKLKEHEEHRWISLEGLRIIESCLNASNLFNSIQSESLTSIIQLLHLEKEPQSWFFFTRFAFPVKDWSLSWTLPSWLLEISLLRHPWDRSTQVFGERLARWLTNPYFIPVLPYHYIQILQFHSWGELPASPPYKIGILIYVWS